MPLGSVFFDSNSVGQQRNASWSAIHQAWCQQWIRLSTFTAQIDAVELYTERPLVGMWATAISAAYPSTGLSFLERPVEKPQNPSGTGLLDLWLAIDGDPLVFEYGVEAKPQNIHGLDPDAAADSMLGTATPELAEAEAANGIALYDAGAALGCISLHENTPLPSTAVLNQFIDDVWKRLEQQASPLISGGAHLVLATHDVRNQFASWGGRTPLASFALFIATERDSGVVFQPVP